GGEVDDVAAHQLVVAGSRGARRAAGRGGGGLGGEVGVDEALAVPEVEVDERRLHVAVRAVFPHRERPAVGGVGDEAALGEGGGGARVRRCRRRRGGGARGRDRRGAAAAGQEHEGEQRQRGRSGHVVTCA